MKVARGEVLLYLEARYHGSVPVTQTTGKKVWDADRGKERSADCVFGMLLSSSVFAAHAVLQIAEDATTKIRDLKQRPVDVDVLVTTKGVYVDERRTRDVIKKVPLENLSFVNIDSRNKKVFAFIAVDPQLDTRTCYAFSVRKHAEMFPKACRQALDRLLAGAKQAESSAHQVASAAPIIDRVDVDKYQDTIKKATLARSKGNSLTVEAQKVGALMDPGESISYIDAAMLRPV